MIQGRDARPRTQGGAHDIDPETTESAGYRQSQVFENHQRFLAASAQRDPVKADPPDPTAATDAAFELWYNGLHF
jgi:hypothetical protein